MLIEKVGEAFRLPQIKIYFSGRRYPSPTLALAGGDTHPLRYDNTIILIANYELLYACSSRLKEKAGINSFIKILTS